MADEIVRVLCKNAPVNAIAVTGRDLVEQARRIHHTLPVATAALGRSLMACSMLGCRLKGKGSSVTLRIRGGGPIGSVTAVSDTDGCVRGCVNNPAVELPLRGDGKLDVGAAVGRAGTLTVIKDLDLKDPYVGCVPLVSGEIAEDLTQYFVSSEQIPTACALGVLVDRDQSVLRAGGYLIQLLPGAGEDTVEKVEQGVRRLGQVTAALLEDADAGQLLRRALQPFEVEVVERRPVSYRCGCSRQRVERALLSMGRAELAGMIEQQGRCEVSCQFCGKVYSFSGEDLTKLLACV